MSTSSSLNIIICVSLSKTTVENGDIIWMSDWKVCVLSVVLIRSVDLQSLMKECGQRQSSHCSENMTSPSLPPSLLSCLPGFSLSHPLYSSVPLSSPSPTLSFFLKLWHHLVWDVVAVLALASRWQPCLMERAFCWKKKCTLQYQDEVILLKNILCVLIHSFKSCNFQSLKAAHYMIVNGNKMKPAVYSPKSI